MRLPLALVLVIALLGSPSAQGAGVSLHDFYGQWRGAEVQSDDLGIELRPQDLGVTVSPDGAGFRLRWIALERDPASGTFVRRESEARFTPTGRPGVFAYDDDQGSLLGRLFASPATGNPLAGETLLWARFDPPTLIVYSLGLTRQGGFELHRMARRLENGGMALEHTIRTEDQTDIAVRGRLQPAGS